MCNWFLNRKIMLQWKFTKHDNKHDTKIHLLKRSKNNPEKEQVLTIAIIIWIWNIVLVDSILRNITLVLEYPEKKLRFPLLGSDIFKEKNHVSIKIITQSTMVRLSSVQNPEDWHEPLNPGCFMDISENGGTPQIIHFNRVFHYKPSILGYPYFWKHPYRDAYIGLL